jgi:TPR repeat protein
MIRALVLAVGLLVASVAGAGAQDFTAEALQARDQLIGNDPPAGKAALERLVAQGDAGAQVLVAGAYFVGIGGFPEDKAQACRLWRAAATTRADAAHLDAECVQKGHDGSRPDPARARTLFQAAADRGSAKSKCALGNLLIAGEGGPADPKRGVALCREGAQAGDRDAQTDLANFYLMGRDVARDPVEARAWYEKAAAQGQANANMTLGQIYWNGDGVAKDNAKAAALWRVAYAKGRLDADSHLGGEAFVRAMADKRRVDWAAVDEAIDWYRKALARDPALRAKVDEPLGLLVKLKIARPDRETGTGLPKSDGGVTFDQTKGSGR